VNVSQLVMSSAGSRWSTPSSALFGMRINPQR
jgi:hypothetical protein